MAEAFREDRCKAIHVGRRFNNVSLVRYDLIFDGGGHDFKWLFAVALIRLASSSASALLRQPARKMIDAGWRATRRSRRRRRQISLQSGLAATLASASPASMRRLSEIFYLRDRVFLARS